MNPKEIKAANIWNEAKRKGLRKFILSHAQQQTEERKLKNELLAIQYQIEDYINTDTPSQPLNILDFVKMYLRVFNVTQKQLAELFEMKDSNLHKYFTRERKLNASLILKLSAFSHLSPEHWLRIEVKNELAEINKEREKMKDSYKYDYRNLLMVAEE